MSINLKSLKNETKKIDFRDFNKNKILSIVTSNRVPNVIIRLKFGFKTQGSNAFFLLDIK